MARFQPNDQQPVTERRILQLIAQVVKREVRRIVGSPGAGGDTPDLTELEEQICFTQRYSFLMG